jgi:hypothetical protein
MRLRVDTGRLYSFIHFLIGDPGQCAHQFIPTGKMAMQCRAPNTCTHRNVGQRSTWILTQDSESGVDNRISR